MKMNNKTISAVIDCLTYPILILDRDGTLLVINKAAQLLLNQPVEIGLPIWEIHWWIKSTSINEKWYNACQSVRNGNRLKFVEPILVSADDEVEVVFFLSPGMGEKEEITHIFVELNGSFPPTKTEGTDSAMHSAKPYPGPDRMQRNESCSKDAKKTRIHKNKEIMPSGIYDSNGKLQEDAQWETERKFRLMVESIEDYAMFMVNNEGLITSWNRGAERLTGYSDIEAIGHHFSMLYPQQAKNKEHAAYELAMAQTNGRHEEEGIRVRKNGTHYHAQIIVWRIEDTAGNTVGYAKITRDITALKEAQLREMQLFETENQFRLMVDSIQDYAMFMVDLKGNITSWNRGAERLTGYTEQEALGRPFSILYPRNEIFDEHAAYELTMARNKGYHEEEGIRVKKDGSVYHAQIIVWPVKDKMGEIVRFAKITRDITARKRTEYALKESEAKFRTMANAMPQIAWSALPDGKNDYVNQQWYQFFGAENKTAVKENWFYYIHPDEEAQISEAWQHSVKNGDNFEAQFRLRHFSGDYRWTLGRALPVLTDGKVVRWMGTLTDIHEQKRAEQSLHESVRRKDDYLAMLAHELRNPLTPIRNCTMLLRKTSSDDANTSKFIDVIDRQVMHMTRLIDDLLDVARIARGKIELRRETFEFSELIKNITNDFKPEYDIKKIKLIVEIPNHLMWVHADYTRISQAIGNLLHNSLKFTEPGGQVSMSLSEETQQGRSFGIVKVKDTGIGINPELLEQLFEPFVQGHQDLARTKGGLGLGLALIKGFANLHGGYIHAKSAGSGHGAEFIFALPLSSAPTHNQHHSSPGKNNISLNVVLIDDNHDIVETLANLLSIEGHIVKYAYDGESGLQLIKSEKPDLVFCDIGLPGNIDGYTIARRVRTDNTINDTFIVALTGYGQERDRKLAFESGFNDHLLKPIDFRALLTIVNQLAVDLNSGFA